MRDPQSYLRYAVGETRSAAGSCSTDYPLSDIIISHELLLRTGQPDYLREKLALQDLAQHMSEQPSELLPRLVNLAMEACDSDSAGISVLRGDQFHWLGLQGALKKFEGATTPRNFSPCGVCLDELAPVLMENPERQYGWISEAGIVVPEVLLVPLMDGERALGTLWVVAREGQHFDAEHARAVTELSKFAGIALRMI